MPGCPNPAVKGGRCAEHVVRYPSRPRESAAARGWGAAWRKVSAAFLKENPDCEMCGAPAVQAHHRVARADGGSDDWANLQALCLSCHSKVTAREQGGWQHRKPGARADGEAG